MALAIKIYTVSKYFLFHYYFIIDSYKGLWEVPLTPSKDDMSNSCVSYQSCKGYIQTTDGFYDYLMKNFFRRYQGNRTPLMLSGNADWFLDGDLGNQRREGMTRT